MNVFPVDKSTQANCDYPGDWDRENKRVKEMGGTIIPMTRVFPVDKFFSVNTVSFLKLENDVIVELDEYWADDGEASFGDKK